MSFIVAGCVLLLALLASIVLDDVGVRSDNKRDKTETTRRYVAFYTRDGNPPSNPGLS